MTKRVKVFLTVVCCLVLVVASIMGTLAYMTNRDEVVNTFTVGKVQITVNETNVDVYGEKVDDTRVKENDYKLIPGKTYIKDPTMTVEKGSEPAYVRMLLTLNKKTQLDEVFAPGIELTEIFKGYDPTVWVFEKESSDSAKNTVTYEFRYKEAVDARDAQNDVKLEALFNSFTLPGSVSSADLELLKDFQITVVGHAIQTAELGTADEAWAAFDEQYPDVVAP